MKVIGILLLSALFLSACTSTYSLDEEFVLGKGEAAKIEGEDFSVRITEFYNSPCPEGAQCIWSGEGIGFEYEYKGETKNGIDLFTVFNYEIILIDTDYESYAKLKIRKYEGQEINVYFNPGVSAEEAKEVLENYGLTWIDRYTLDTDRVSGRVKVPFWDAMEWQERLTADEKIDYALVYVVDTVVEQGIISEMAIDILPLDFQGLVGVQVITGDGTWTQGKTASEDERLMESEEFTIENLATGEVQTYTSESDGTYAVALEVGEYYICQNGCATITIEEGKRTRHDFTHERPSAPPSSDIPVEVMTDYDTLLSELPTNQGMLTLNKCSNTEYEIYIVSTNYLLDGERIDTNNYYLADGTSTTKEVYYEQLPTLTCKSLKRVDRNLYR